MYEYEKKNFGPSDAGELTAGPCDPRVGLAPPTCRNVACTGLSHPLLSGTPTRGGSSLMAKLGHPSSGSVEALRPSHPLSLTVPPAKMLAVFLPFSLVSLLFPSFLPSCYPLWAAGLSKVPAPSLILLLRPSSLA